MRSKHRDRTRMTMAFSERVVIVDTSEIEDGTDYGGLLYELKSKGFRDGEAYQIDNAGDLLMHRGTYDQCRLILERFGAKSITP